ncbi:winged helix-turn-helix domain-containing protein [Kroppenstedtia sanguinis]|uniref:Helix-turn-helix domain-containing protein n=1 Tax=Kroppenstedtia sanguinis TaxID=1380684 RepID=A0ABW4CAJ9_9BACL
MILPEGQKLFLGPNCYLNTDEMTVVKNNLPIALSVTQFRMMHILTLNIGKPVSIKNLAELIFGENTFLARNRVYICIRRIREKIEDDPNRPKYLITLSGPGYMLVYHKNT